MKIIKLIALALTNFKGIHNFTLNANGSNVDVYGDNAAGKTTLFDAFSWLLFDKDSQGNSGAEKWIKTLDADGQVIHKLEHSVEGVLSIDGKNITLKKVFKEMYKRPRGTAEEVFDGHTTAYYFNGSEVKKTDYNKEIANIIDEDLFKLLTNPSYFNEQYDQKKRRALLFEIFGDNVTDDDVIKLNPNLSIVKQILADKPLATALEDVKKAKNAADKAVKDIPTQIRENENAIFATKARKPEIIEQALLTTRELIAEQEAKLSGVKTGGEIAVKQQKKLELQNEILQLKNELQSSNGADAGVVQQKLIKVNSRIAEVESEIKRLERAISDDNKRVDQLEVKLVDLRAQKAGIDDRVFINSIVTDSCPTCKQSLPAEEVAQAMKAAEEQFNLVKSQDKERVVREGKATKAEQDALKVTIAENQAKLEENKAGLEKLNGHRNDVQAELDKASTSTVDVTQDERYKVLQRHIDNIDAEIASINDNSQAEIDKVQSEINRLRGDIAVLESERAQHETAQRSHERISELKAQEKDLLKKYEEAAVLENNLLEFSRAKARAVEHLINEKFENVRFRLFEQQVNGEFKDVCETLYGPNLVPYNAGLNRAAQINAGLEIINALSAHYKVIAPIFIDNSEAVTKMTITPGQQIRLTVSAGDKELRVESDGVGVSAGSIVMMAASELATTTTEDDDLF